MLRAAGEAVLGAEPPVVGDHPWMDAAFTAAAGIPTVVFGPGGAGAHAVEEYGDLRQRRGVRGGAQRDRAAPVRVS